MRRITIALFALCLTATPVVADPLPEGVVARVGSVHFWDRGFHVALAFSPDGKTLATCGENLCAWDVATGKCVFRRPVKNRTLVGFHSDGKSLRIVEEGIAHVFDSSTGRPIRTQPLERKPALDDAGAISPDGRFAAFPVTESISQLFDLETGKAVRSFNGRGPGHPEYIFSADGKFLAIASGVVDGEVALPVFDTATGEVAITIREPGKAIYAAAMSPGRKHIVTAARIDRDSETLAVWDGTTGKLIRRLVASKSYVGAFAISRDGKWLAFCDGPIPELRMIELSNGQELWGIRSRLWAANLVFSPDRLILAVATYKGGIILLDAATGKPLPVSADYLGEISQLRFTNAGKNILVAANDIGIRDWRTGTVVRRLFDPREDYRQLYAISPDVRRMAVADRDGTVRVLDPDSGRTQLTKAGNDPVSYYLDFTPDSELLVALGERETPWVWTLADGKRVNLRETPDPNARTHGLTPNGQWHETADHDGEILLRLRSLPDGRVVRQRMLPKFGWDKIDFSPDDRLIALTYYGCHPHTPRLVVWDTHTNSKRSGFAVPGVVVRPVAFSPDGRIFAACDQDGAIRLFEVASGQERRILRGHQSEIEHIAFSPDGSHLMAASPDAPIFVWDMWRTHNGPVRTEAERENLWVALADTDAAIAFRAMCRLRAAPDDALSMLKANLKPEAPLPPQWLTDLTDPRFAVRDRAATELTKVADRHQETLRLERDRATSAEARRRLQLLLDQSDPPSGERLRQVRAVEVLEQIGTPTAVALLRNLAAGAEGAGLTLDAQTALRRIAAAVPDQRDATR